MSQNPWDEYHLNEEIKEVYERTDVVRKPISGIVSGYHQLPYILVAPSDDDGSGSVQIAGAINVSPRFVISPQQLGEAFSDVFDPETFDKEIHGRVFSFAYGRRKNVRVDSQRLDIRSFDERPTERLSRVEDDLAQKENVRTALIFGPRFAYYPVSIDRFVNEILDREFRL